MKRSCNFLFFQRLQQSREDPAKKRKIGGGSCALRGEMGANKKVEDAKEHTIYNGAEIGAKPCMEFEGVVENKEEREMDIEQASESHPPQSKDLPEQTQSQSNSPRSCDQCSRPHLKRKHTCFRRRRRLGKKKKKRKSGFILNLAESAVLYKSRTM